MKKFIIPVVYTITGHIEVEAKTWQEAMDKGELIEKLGVKPDAIQDPSTSLDVMIEELEEVK